jgi:hypothetical protein
MKPPSRLVPARWLSSHDESQKPKANAHSVMMSMTTKMTRAAARTLFFGNSNISIMKEYRFSGGLTA